MKKAKSEELFKAAMLGDAAAVKKLLAAGVSADARSNIPGHTHDPGEGELYEPGTVGWTPLLVALLRGHRAVVDCLLEHADLDAHVASYGQHLSVLAAAAFAGPAFHDVIERCLAAGVPIDGPGSSPTPLIYAVCGGHAKTVRLLLQRGADPMLEGSKSPLHHTLWMRTPAAVAEALLDDPRCSSDGTLMRAFRHRPSRTDLPLGIYHGRSLELGALIDGTPDAAANRRLIATLDVLLARKVFKRTDPEVAEALGNAIPLPVFAHLLKIGATRKHWLEDTHGILERLELVLAAGHKLSKQDRAEGLASLIRSLPTADALAWVDRLLALGCSATVRGTLADAAQTHSVEVVERLLLAGADPADTGYNIPALAFAISRGDVAMAEVLLDAGAPVDAVLDSRHLSSVRESLKISKELAKKASKQPVPLTDYATERLAKGSAADKALLARILDGGAADLLAGFDVTGRPGFQTDPRGVLVIGRRFENATLAALVACAKVCDAQPKKSGVKAVPAGYVSLLPTDSAERYDLVIGIAIAEALEGEDQCYEGEPVVVSAKKLRAAEAAYATLRSNAKFWTAIAKTGIAQVTDVKEGLHLVGAGGRAVTSVEGDASAATVFDDVTCTDIVPPKRGWSKGLVLTAQCG